VRPERKWSRVLWVLLVVALIFLSFYGLIRLMVYNAWGIPNDDALLEDVVVNPELPAEAPD
jgi:hypothetical protein